MIHRLKKFLRLIFNEGDKDYHYLIVTHGGVIFNLLCRIWSFDLDIDEWLLNCRLNEVNINLETKKILLTKINGSLLNPSQELDFDFE